MTMVPTPNIDSLYNKTHVFQYPFKHCKIDLSLEDLHLLTVLLNGVYYMSKTSLADQKGLLGHYELRKHIEDLKELIEHIDDEVGQSNI